MSYYGVGGPGGPPGGSGGDDFDFYRNTLGPVHNLNPEEQALVLERQQALEQGGYSATAEDLALHTGLDAGQIRAFLNSLQPSASQPAYASNNPSQAGYGYGAPPTMEPSYAPAPVTLADVQRARARAKTMPGGLRRPKRADSAATSAAIRSSAVTDTRYTQGPPPGPSYAPPPQASYGAFSPYPQQMGPPPSSSALRTRPIIPIEVQSSSYAPQHSSPNYPSTPYTSGPQPSGPSYAPPQATGPHGGDEDSLFGGSPPQSPVVPGHGFALPGASGSMVQLPGASVGQSSVAPLSASSYDPYTAASVGSSRLLVPSGGRGGEASGPPLITLADVQNARAKATSDRLRPPKRKRTSAATISSAQAESSSPAVTVYRLASKQDRDTMEKLGGYKRGTDNENNDYLITPQGEAFILKNSRKHPMGYYQAMAGLIEAANQSKLPLGAVGRLFGQSGYWLRKP